MDAPCACGDCHRSQLDSTCCRGGLLRRSARIQPHADGADHISALPEDMLLQVLARIGCARAAAHTGLLSPRWRGLWTHLPVLTFHNIGPEPLHAALAQVARPAGSLRIRIPTHHLLLSARILELLHAIAALAPAELCVDVWEDTRGGQSFADDRRLPLPRFERTTSITLNFEPMFSRWLRLVAPSEGFLALEGLSILLQRRPW
ncbi:unnamed protein product [Urochloa humidicola]